MYISKTNHDIYKFEILQSLSNEKLTRFLLLFQVCTYPSLKRESNFDANQARRKKRRDGNAIQECFDESFTRAEAALSLGSSDSYLSPFNLSRPSS